MHEPQPALKLLESKYLIPDQIPACPERIPGTMALRPDSPVYTEKRLSMDSNYRMYKRATLSDSGLCLVCGRRATGRCSKCAIATFCGPQCQSSAGCSHAGATQQVTCA